MGVALTVVHHTRRAQAIFQLIEAHFLDKRRDLFEAHLRVLKGTSFHTPIEFCENGRRHEADNEAAFHRAFAMGSNNVKVKV